MNLAELNSEAKMKCTMGRGGGGQVVSVLAFYSIDLSMNPDDTYSSFCKF